MPALMREIFNPLLERQTSEILIIYRAHRVRRLRSQSAKVPRDVIVRFHYVEEKATITEKAQWSPGMKFKGTTLQIYADLAVENLTRILKPLTEQMRQVNIQYWWGFPSGLKGIKDGRTAVLKGL